MSGVSVTGVSKSYGSVNALTGASLNIRQDDLSLFSGPVGLAIPLYWASSLGSSI